MTIIVFKENFGDGGGGVAPAPGPAPSAAAVIITKLAGQNMSALKAVYLDGDNLFYASSADLVNVHNFFGVTLTGNSTGNDVKVMISGEIVDPSFNFVDGPVFLGLNGSLTQVAATTGVHIQIGNATDVDTLFVRIEAPILL